MVDVKKDIGVPVAVGIATGLTLFWIRDRFSRQVFTAETLVDPDSVANLADGLPDNDFVLAAWQLVGGDIEYSGYGSVLRFVNSHVECQRCLLPEQVLDHGVANCVGKSALLTSILRNRMPPSDVYLVLGEYRGTPPGGHAWVQVKRGGTWYLIESTSPPPAQPWVTVDAFSEVYVPHAWFNDTGLICYNPDICSFAFSVNKKPCPCRTP